MADHYKIAIIIAALLLLFGLGEWLMRRKDKRGKL
jgi:hypothetical protein